MWPVRPVQSQRATVSNMSARRRNNSLVIVIGHRDGIVAKQIISGGYKTCGLSSVLNLCRRQRHDLAALSTLPFSPNLDGVSLRAVDHTVVRKTKQDR